MMRLARVFHHDGGAAAAEMVLVLPFLLVLMFGSAEMGNYFLDEHGLVKQVRDGARYASRIPLEANYTCPNTVNPAAKTLIENVTKTGTVGHPDLATAEKGKRFLTAIVKDVTTFVDEFAKW